MGRAAHAATPLFCIVNKLFTHEIGMKATVSVKLQQEWNILTLTVFLVQLGPSGVEFVFSYVCLGSLQM